MVQPPQRSRPHPKFLGRPVYYGWWIVLGTAVLGAMGGGFFIFGISAFIIPLTDEFGVGRGDISWAVSLATLEGAVLGPLQGYFIDRFGPRRIMVIGITMLGLGFIFISMAPSLLWFFVFFVPFISIGSGMGTFAPPAAAIGNWFIRKRSIAMSLGMSGWGLGAILVSLTNLLVENLGWRDAAMVIGFVIMAVGYPTLLLFRHKPELHGYLPDGDVEPRSAIKSSDGSTPIGEIDFTVKEALRSRAFWLICLSFAFRMFAVAGITAHFIPMMGEKGLSASAAAGLLGLYGFTTIPARIIFGYFGDRVSKAKIGGWMAVVMAVAFGILGLTDNLVAVTFAVLLYAFAWGGGGGAMMLALRGDFFGRKNFATISGWSNVVQNLGVFAGPVAAGYIFDGTGSYKIAWILYIGFILVAAVSLLIVKRPTPLRLQQT